MRRTWFGAAVLLILTLLMPIRAAAQTDPPDNPDPVRGGRLFQERCATCHGPQGDGNGELAASLPNPPVAIGTAAYLSDADPAAMFQIIQNGNLVRGMPGFGVGNNSNPLSAADTWDIIAALAVLEQLSRPLPEVAIAGQLSHAENLEIPAELIVILQAFDQQANEALRLETTVGPNGTYQFDLQEIPPSWFFRTTVEYQQIDFTSQLAPIDPADPQIDLPITLFETTTADDALHITRLTLLFEFVEDQVQIAELYVFENRQLSVYTGRTGDPTDGTIYIPLSLPDGASPTALRVIGGGSTLLPLELIEDPGAGVWATIPVGPGPEALTMIVRYQLPIETVLNSDSGLVRRLDYPVDQVDLIVPDVGVTVAGDAWRFEEPVDSENFADGLARLRFVFQSTAPDGHLTLSLTGWPERVTDANGAVIVNRNPNRELFWGISGVALAFLIGMGLIWRWTTAPPAIADRDDLLLRLAALEEAFERGNVPKTAYRRRRAQLMAALREIWPT